MSRRAFVPGAPVSDDDDHVRANGMWYEEWQSGYHDILRAGHRRPRFKSTILAKLHSPHPPDFLHAGPLATVPFLVSDRARKRFRQAGLSGIRFSPVEVVKIATKGLRERAPRHGEPEDAILKARTRLPPVAAPRLHAVRVIGRLEVVPEHDSGRCRGTGFVSPFALPESESTPDLWMPTVRGRRLRGWVFCSARFRDVVRESELSNISFEEFGATMRRYRRESREKDRLDSD